MKQDTDHPAGGPTAAFKTFPEFSKLTPADRRAYEALIKDFPPISDISFGTLMVWWNVLDSLAIALLNGNLVISYWLPGDERHSGLSLVGTNLIDESICAILDHLKSEGRPARLVHVPEFVVSELRYPELFAFHEERSYDECVLSVGRIYPLSHVPIYRRRNIRRFLLDTDEDRIVVKSLDLSDEENQRMILESLAKWPKKGLNQSITIALDSIKAALKQADALGIENVVLFIDGVLQAFCLYQLPHDKRYAIISHVRVNYDIPRIFDFMTYAFARWFADQGVSRLNIEMDFGVSTLRIIKLMLKPDNFFRKYTIEPAK